MLVRVDKAETEETHCNCTACFLWTRYIQPDEAEDVRFERQGPAFFPWGLRLRPC